jgi:60 kDa SS-A/Ro ribonucleoprotein
MEPVPGKQTVVNNAGGYVFQVSPQTRLDRFLMLGSENGSYYCGSRKMTLDNVSAVRAMIKDDGPGVVSRTVEISQSGRAPKNDPALFVMALCLAEGDTETKQAVKENISKVTRTATHFFLFVQYATAMRGWGRALKSAAASWYNEKSPFELAYQTTKYKNREGWTHYDVLNVAHVKPIGPEKQSLFRMITDKNEATLDRDDLISMTERYSSQEEMPAGDYYKFCSNTGKLGIEELAGAIAKYRLPHEVLPSEALAEPKIWRALLDTGMPMTAMIRNIGRMASMKIFNDKRYIDILRNRLLSPEQLKKARIHPLNVLTAWKTYSSGHGVKGQLKWDVDDSIVRILEDSFYASFSALEPTGKNILIGLDVSGSMCSEAWNNLTAREISSVMCMSVVRGEPNHIVKAFCHEFVDVWFGACSPLDEVIAETEAMSFGGTDCALPMIYAAKSKIPVDAFIVYTDNETWCGGIHPFQALKDYRKAMGIDAKLIVVGITATCFSIADPEDAGMLDVVGFDSAVPQVISDFIRG